MPPPREGALAIPECEPALAGRAARRWWVSVRLSFFLPPPPPPLRATARAARDGPALTPVEMVVFFFVLRAAGSSCCCLRRPGPVRDWACFFFGAWRDAPRELLADRLLATSSSSCSELEEEEEEEEEEDKLLVGSRAEMAMGTRRIVCLPAVGPARGEGNGLIGTSSLITRGSSGGLIISLVPWMRTAAGSEEREREPSGEERTSMQSAGIIIINCLDMVSECLALVISIFYG